MTQDMHARGSWRLVVVAVAALATGVAGTALWLRPSATIAVAPATDGPAGGAVQPASPQSATTVALSPEAVRRAGIVITPVEAGPITDVLRLAATVEPNAYEAIVVTPVAGGRITRVSAALGDQVSAGQVLAEVFSPELSDEQARYLTMSAELEAAHQRLRRTERLAQIGAASTQELERVRAEHVTHATDVEMARAKLTLLGLTPEQVAALRAAPDVNATISVRAPRAGVVTERLANVGLNVDPSSALFRVVDLSSVWIVADIHERDFARVRVGSDVTITLAAYPELRLRGRVSYVDPQVRPETRTARARIEVPNPGHRLRLGLYAEVVVASAQASGLLVPRTAVQTVGDRQVVYVADATEPGRFVERMVRTGAAVGDRIPVLSGLSLGEQVVSQGSFSLRAERERTAQTANEADPHAQHGPAMTAPQ
jgi:membrane fusion protein, heavy metal efflux system